MAQVTLKGNTVNLEREFIHVGTVAPEFLLVDKELKERKLKDFGKKKKLLSIVPSLDTGVCLTSAKVLNKAAKEHPHLQILVISADLPFAQTRACTTENLNNITTLSMMRNKDFGRNYGVLMTDGPLAGLCARAIVVLDENNQVIYTQLVKEITTEPNYAEALAILK